MVSVSNKLGILNNLFNQTKIIIMYYYNFTKFFVFMEFWAGETKFSRAG